MISKIARRIVESVGALIGGLVGYYAFRVWLARLKYSHIPGPQLNGFDSHFLCCCCCLLYLMKQNMGFSSIKQFFLGNFPDKEWLESNGIIFSDLLIKWHRQFGPVIKFQIANHIVVSTVDPNAIRVNNRI